MSTHLDLNTISKPIGHIGIGEKVGFGLGDLACNLIYASLSSYLLFYYTDVLAFLLVLLHLSF